ncbi:MAG TPA: TetR/AcrR family transcriptional regulator [Frankiaceae bacterium]|nr:TetR/AcrR family transcriptional regulator [Frankiaceae bacterium]
MTVTSVDPRQVRRRAKRANILAEAWGLARRDGLAVISLRDLAERVGLRQPSLYVYFASKGDLYDAMFADGYRQLLEYIAASPSSSDPRRALARFAGSLVQFASDDVVRHQLLFQRTIPGFEPSPESYALALDFYALAVERLAAAGVHAQGEVDIFSALVSGLAHQQIANDPGGKRWVRQAGRVVDMFLADVDRRRSSTRSQGRTR